MVTKRVAFGDPFIRWRELFKSRKRLLCYKMQGFGAWKGDLGLTGFRGIFAEFLLDIVLREADRPDVVVFKRAKNFFEKFKLLSGKGLRRGDFGGLLGFGRSARNGMSLGRGKI